MHLMCRRVLFILVLYSVLKCLILYIFRLTITVANLIATRSLDIVMGQSR
jgi:hypothetical protein